MFSAISDLELRIALAVAAIALIVTAGLTLQVLLMRLAGTRREARRRLLRERWRPLFLRAAAGEDELLDAQPLRRDEALEVLLLWNQLQDSLRGSAHEGLNQLASRMGELDSRDEIVFVCKIGKRSAKAAELVRGAGFDRVRSLEGGLIAWSREIDPSMPVY